MRLDAQLRNWLQRGKGLREFYDQEFTYYRHHWLRVIERPDHDPVEMNEERMMRDLRLWYLIYAAMANFSNPVPAFRCFLFHEASRLTEADCGSYVSDRVTEWH